MAAGMLANITETLSEVALDFLARNRAQLPNISEPSLEDAIPKQKKKKKTRHWEMTNT